MKLRIRTKILIIVVVFFMLATGTNTFVNSHVFRKEYSSALHSKMDVIADTLRSQIERLLSLGITIDNIEGFESQCQEVLQKHKDVAYVMVTRTTGNILFHNDMSLHNTMITDQEILTALKDNKQTVRISKIAGNTYYNTVLPVVNSSGELDIAVIVGSPISIIDSKIQELRNYGFIVATISLGIASFLLLSILSVSVTKPLSKLVTTTQQIRESSDLSRKVEINSTDEIGDLAASFNNMVQDLNKTTVSRNALMEEVAERKKAEEQLRQAEEKYRTQFEGALDAIFVADAETGILVDCNPAATRLVGREKSELIGQHQRTLHPPGKIDGEFSNTYKKHLNEQEGQTLETQVITKNGEIKDVAITASLIEVQGKKLMQGIFRDITIRKKAEKSLKDLNEKLIQSNQQLQEFTYIASHDLREPARKINSFGQMLVESLADKLSEDDSENFNFMIDGAYRMVQMIEALLTYSHVTLKGVEYERLDLSEIIEQLSEFELAFKLEGTDGTISVPEPLPAVKGDAAQIRQLMQNLLSNALKYRKKDTSPKVTIRAHEEDNGMFRIEVQDNGIGIKKEQYDKVFVMFRRLHSRDEYEGTGIGLAVCKRIVERHGGEIGVESTYGHGSTFWFTLPALRSVQKHSEPVLAFAKPECNDN